ncbi:uncharacterized protein LOC114299050 [Camellia sinensis]|uniref:uncharacterized protein LOC114299050 n=1 Tax=Camellia sinensis TaxID=4442 RepID=UPI001035B5CB|nr:uncharacterized protein LOC114299050 [Camellia sinensis]
MTSPSFSICLNGSLYGYFKGARGLWQGDPISPYLFVIVMEILARILAEKSTLPDFRFHWRCEKTKIINLCFADDLMIFCRGDVSTLRENIINIVNFAEGVFPVRYLGVPLITTKLKASDCHQLVERITKKIKSWTSECLSYAGRSQLIQSILFSMQVNWTSLFILPKKIIKEIESLLRSFFWSGSVLSKFGAKVSWDQVCAPKNEGGLGFKSLDVWNKAAMAKHVWFLFLGGVQSMWCHWVHSYLLKGRSFWRVKVPSDPYWVWRKILSLRPLVFPLIKHIIGDGGNVFLWHDNWHPLGSLYDRFGARIIHTLPDNSKVNVIVENNSWKWPRAASQVLKELIDSTPPSLVPRHATNRIVWLPATDGKFSINSTWNPWRKSFAKGNSVGAIISRLGFTCTVYQLWLARNNKIFNNDAYPEDVVIKRIMDMIRFRMLSITNLKNHSNDSWFLNKWRLPISILKERCSDGSRRTLSDVRSDNCLQAGLSVAIYHKLRVEFWCLTRLKLYNGAFSCGLSVERLILSVSVWLLSHYLYGWTGFMVAAVKDDGRYVHGPYILSMGPMNILFASANSLLLRVLFVASAHISIRFWLKF